MEKKQVLLPVDSYDTNVSYCQASSVALTEIQDPSPSIPFSDFNFGNDVSGSSETGVLQFSFSDEDGASEMQK